MRDTTEETRSSVDEAAEFLRDFGLEGLSPGAEEPALGGALYAEGGFVRSDGFRFRGFRGTADGGPSRDE